MNTDLITLTSTSIQITNNINEKDSLLYWVNLYYQTEIVGSPEKTVKAKKADLTKFINFYSEFSHSDHVDLWTPALSKSFMQHLNKAELDFKATTINRIHATIKTFSRWLHNQRPLPAGEPFAKVKTIAVDEPIWSGLTNNEISALKIACDQRLKMCTHGFHNPLLETTIFHMLLNTGLREFELAQLNFNQYQDKGLNHVKRKGQKVSSKIPLPIEAREYLDQYLDSRENLEPNSPLLTTRYNNRINVRDIQRICSRIAKQANAYRPIEKEIKLTPHMLRHTFLKKVADKHGIHYAQKMSGNVSMREIFRYTKPSQDEIDKTAEELFD